MKSTGNQFQPMGGHVSMRNVKYFTLKYYKIIIKLIIINYLIIIIKIIIINYIIIIIIYKLLLNISYILRRL